MNHGTDQDLEEVSGDAVDEGSPSIPCVRS